MKFFLRNIKWSIQWWVNKKVEDFWWWAAAHIPVKLKQFSFILLAARITDKNPFSSTVDEVYKKNFKNN